MMDKKRKPLNNQQLTNTVDNHEIRITKLETKKKKIIKKCGKGPKVTIADVMQTLVQFQNSVDERFNNLEASVDQRFDKIETRIDKLETRMDKIENEIKDLNKRVDVLNEKVDALDHQFNALNKRVVLIENEIFRASDKS